VLLVSTIAFFRVSILPQIGDDLSLSTAELGVLTMVFGLGRLATDVPAGRYADRVRPEPAFATAGLVIGAGSFWLAGSNVALAAYGAAFVLGVGSSISNTTGMTYFSRAVPVERRGTSLAVFSASLLGGQSLGPAVAGVIAAGSGWRATEVVGGALGLATAAAFLLRPRRTPAARPVAAAAAPLSRPVRIPAVERVVLYGVSYSMFFMLGSMPQTLVPVIGDSELGLGSAAIGLALGLGGLSRFVGAFAGGLVSDRVSRKAALVPGMAMVAGGVSLLAIDAGAGLWVASIVLMSIGSFGVSVAATMLADRTHVSGVGRRFGSFRFVGDLGLVSGPVATGFLYAHTGRAAAVLAVAGLCGLVSLASAVVLTETRHEHGPLELQGE
jgi:MFS family permease